MLAKPLCLRPPRSCYSELTDTFGTQLFFVERSLPLAKYGWKERPLGGSRRPRRHVYWGGLISRRRLPASGSGRLLELAPLGRTTSRLPFWAFCPLPCPLLRSLSSSIAEPLEPLQPPFDSPFTCPRSPCSSVGKASSRTSSGSSGPCCDCSPVPAVPGL